MGGENFRPIPGRQAATPGQEQLYVLRHAGYVLFLRRAAARYSLHDLCWVRHGGQPGRHEGKLTEAFKKAGTVLRIMKRLAEEAEQRVVE